jgi:hypothetical protein
MKNILEPTKGTITITDKDIANIEFLRDILLDHNILGLNHTVIKKSIKLTSKMYKSLDY